jgi:hypothetical protein
LIWCLAAAALLLELQALLASAFRQRWTACAKYTSWLLALLALLLALLLLTLTRDAGPGATT